MRRRLFVLTEKILLKNNMNLAFKSVKANKEGVNAKELEKLGFLFVS